jgi:N-acetylmuramoyl-L-alanine amidase
LKLAIAIILLLSFGYPSFACNNFFALAENIYHEARGEGYKAMLAVGEVTINRVESESFPDTICDTVYQKSQFSWTKNNPKITENDQWGLSLIIAAQLYAIDHNFVSNGATYFLNLNHVKKPKWAHKLKVVAVIGQHTFFKPKG